MLNALSKATAACRLMNEGEVTTGFYSYASVEVAAESKEGQSNGRGLRGVWGMSQYSCA